MSQAESEQIEPASEFPTILIARRCRLNPELLSRWEEMRTFLKIRENRDRIESLSDIQDCIDPDCLDENELNEIQSELRALSEAVFEA